jgi:tetratricopeptide (TPR) repeat protein
MKTNRFELGLIIALIFNALFALGQSEKQSIRQGNKEYKKGEFLDSEISYRSALESNPSSFKGNFNLGGALYKQNNFEEAASIFENLSAGNISEKEKAKIYHNLGNSLFNQQKYAESVEAYKNALRNNPKDNQTKYNLAQAQRMLVQQQQQQNNQGEGQDNKDQQDQDQKDQKDNKDQQNKEQDQQKQEQPQEKEQQVSPDDARRMLEALQNNERDIQDRVREQQAKAAKVKVEKNW